MKILLGGIPLGCDNIGDEAIIAGVVKMLRESIPGVGLTVATADGATGPLLGVDVAPPFGFAGCSKAGFADALRGHDAYIWCGATGLSDYPHVALDLLEIAQREGVATYVWGVGMDDELNPVFFDKIRQLMDHTEIFIVMTRRVLGRKTKDRDSALTVNHHMHFPVQTPAVMG